MGVYRLANNTRILVGTPLTEEELEAYKKHPNTFFDAIDPNAGRKIVDHLGWYDFFYESYSKTPKEKLLEFMKEASDIEKLKDHSQEELAKTYCERLAYSVMRDTSKKK